MRATPAPLVVHSPEYACDLGPHVFPTAKYDAVRRQLVEEGWVGSDQIAAPPPASRAELECAHQAEYLDDLEQLRWNDRTASSEIPLGPEIVAAHRLAAGGTLLAARAALERGLGVHLGGGFHHASPGHAEGFCYLNDVAVALLALRYERRLRRAAVVDLDVHQGNGTARICESVAEVFTLSVHQESNYPVPKAHSTLDVGLEDGAGDESYAAALEPALAAVWAFAPELVIYVAGADPYVDDQLGGLALTLEGLGRRDRSVLEGCSSRSIPAVITFGGGYARRLEDTVRIHTQTCREAFVAYGHNSLRR